jgi:hypothetical protein
MKHIRKEILWKAESIWWTVLALNICEIDKTVILKCNETRRYNSCWMGKIFQIQRWETQEEVKLVQDEDYDLFF